MLLLIPPGALVGVQGRLRITRGHHVVHAVPDTAGMAAWLKSPKPRWVWLDGRLPGSWWFVCGDGGFGRGADRQHVGKPGYGPVSSVEFWFGDLGCSEECQIEEIRCSLEIGTSPFMCASRPERGFLFAQRLCNKWVTVDSHQSVSILCPVSSVRIRPRRTCREHN